MTLKEFLAGCRYLPAALDIISTDGESWQYDYNMPTEVYGWNMVTYYQTDLATATITVAPPAED